MKNHLTLLLGVFIFGYGFAQDTRFWKKNRNPIQNKNISTTARNTEISQQNTYDLRVDKFKEVLSKCPKRFSSFGPSNVIITLPAKDGKFKKVSCWELSFSASNEVYLLQIKSLSIK